MRTRHHNRTRHVIVLAASLVSLLAFGGSAGPARAEDPAPPAGEGQAADTGESQPQARERDRALERSLRFRVVTAATSRSEGKRAEAEAAIAAADTVSRYFAFCELLDHGRTPVRLYAARGLLGIGERAAVPRIVHQLVRDPRREARIELTRVLRAFDVEGTGGLFANYLNEREHARRFRALQSMGVFRDRRVVPVLVRRLHVIYSGFPQAAANFTTDSAYIKGWKVVSGGTGNTVVEVADPEIDVVRTGVSLEVKVRRVEIVMTTELLRDLTGQSLGPQPAAWAEWLRDNPDFALAPSGD
jgi:hypothetical protein